MKLKSFLLLLVFLKALPSFSQTKKPDTIRAFFNLNDFKVSSDDQLKISSIKDSMNNKAVVKILGYGDNTGTPEFNKTLSIKRAADAKAFLMSLNKSLKVTAKGMGQIQSPGQDPKTGFQFNRRVDIIFEKPIVIVAQVPPPPPAPAPAPRDTTPIAAPAPAPPPAPQVAAVDTSNAGLAKINQLAKLEVGGSISLPELTFIPGKHELDNDSKPYMDALLATLKSHPTVSVEIQGFICCDYRKKDGFDSETKKYELSTNRAKTVYDFLVANGIDASRMKYVGLGNTKPKVFPEQTNSDREKNRRVELVVLSK